MIIILQLIQCGPIGGNQGIGCLYVRHTWMTLNINIVVDILNSEARLDRIDVGIPLKVYFHMVLIAAEDVRMQTPHQDRMEGH